MKKPKPDDEIKLFKAWLVERGAEILATTNEYEIVRFRANGVTSILYKNAKGRTSAVGDMAKAWTAFQGDDKQFRLTAVEPRASFNRAERDLIIRSLIERDGNVCFYCGLEFTSPRDNRRTKEHLVSRTHGGPEHISNLFLSCLPCNVEAGNLSAPEKIKMRDRKRRGKGSALLARAFDRFFGGEGDPTLLDDIKSFLHLNQPKGDDHEHAS